MRQRSKPLPHTHSYMYTCTLHLSSLAYGKVSPPPGIEAKSLSLVFFGNILLKSEQKKETIELEYARLRIN